LGAGLTGDSGEEGERSQCQFLKLISCRSLALMLGFSPDGGYLQFAQCAWGASGHHRAVPSRSPRGEPALPLLGTGLGGGGGT
jgi:hypothetical protein